jgi:hypothetical protein
VFSFFQAEYSWASEQYRKALKCIGRPLPTSNLDLFASLVWNLGNQTNLSHASGLICDKLLQHILLTV